MSEGDVQRKIQLHASVLGARLLRNQVGQYRLALPDCGRCQTEGRVIRSGLAVGSSDLIGWHRVTITPEMVGRTLAVFTAVEVKSKRGRPTKDQTRFLQAITDQGGFAGIARAPIFLERNVANVDDELF